jgi:hypothetical protein
MFGLLGALAMYVVVKGLAAGETNLGDAEGFDYYVIFETAPWPFSGSLLGGFVFARVASQIQTLLRTVISNGYLRSMAMPKYCLVARLSLVCR